MAIEKVVTMKLDADQATINLEHLNEQLEIQKQVLIDLERELYNVEKAQKDTSHRNLAAQKMLSDQAKVLRTDIEGEKIALKQLNVERKTAVNVVKELNVDQTVSSDVIQSLDMVTQGYASRIQILAGAFVSAGKSVKKFVIGLSTMQKALIATGVGALVVAVGLLVAYWDEFLVAIGQSTDEMKAYNDAMIQAEVSTAKSAYETNKYNDIVQDTTKSEQERHRALQELEKIGIATGDITLNNATSLLVLNGRIKRNIDLVMAKAKADALGELMQDAMKKQIEATNMSLEDSITWWDRTKNVLIGTQGPGKNAILMADGLKRKLEAVAAANGDVEKATKQYEEALEALNILEGESASIHDKVRDQLEQRAAAEAVLSEALNSRRLIEEQALAIARATEDQLKILRAEGIEKEIVKIVQNYQDRIDITKKVFGVESEEYHNLLILRAAEIKEVEDRLAQETLEDRLSFLDEMDVAIALSEAEKREMEIDKMKAYYDELISQAKDYGLSTLDLETARTEALSAVTNQHNKEDLAASQTILDAKLAAQLGFASALQGVAATLYGLFEEGTKASKAAALAEIAIGTGIGFIQGLDIAQKGAKAAGPAAPFAFPIFFATQLAAVFGAAAQARNILKTAPGPDGGGPPPAPTIPAAPSFDALTPNFNTVGASSTNQLADALGNQVQRPVQAYVVANDVTSAQSLDRNIITGATVG